MIEQNENVVGSSVQLVTEVMKAAGNSPELREAGNNLAGSMLIITETVKNCLVPLAAVNFAFDKARNYFNTQFQQDIAEHTKNIPSEHIVEPKASVAGPTLQGLAFSHEEAELKAMFLNLLTTSMDERTASKAHPAFVEIIKQLTAEEARLLPFFVKTVHPIVELRRKAGKTGTSTVVRHLLNLQSLANGEPVVNESLSSMIDNWIRLGLVEVDYQKTLVAPRAYEWVESRPEYKRCVSNLNSNTDEKIMIAKGMICPTDLGRQFALAVDIAQ